VDQCRYAQGGGRLKFICWVPVLAEYVCMAKLPGFIRGECMVRVLLPMSHAFDKCSGVVQQIHWVAPQMPYNQAATAVTL